MGDVYTISMGGIVNKELYSWSCCCEAARVQQSLALQFLKLLMSQLLLTVVVPKEVLTFLLPTMQTKTSKYNVHHHTQER